jgi:hypothetical protein
VNGNSIGAERIDAGRIEEIELQIAEAGVPESLHVVCKKPPEIRDDVRPGNSGNFMPEYAGLRRALWKASHPIEIINPLGVQVDFDAWLQGEAFEGFSDGSLRAVAPVDKRGNNREPQVSASSGA